MGIIQLACNGGWFKNWRPIYTHSVLAACVLSGFSLQRVHEWTGPPDPVICGKKVCSK